MAKTRKTSKTSATPRKCKECPEDSNRPAPYTGPRCATHHRLRVKEAKSKSRDSYLRNTYGISEEEYLDIKRHQNGKCYICQRATGASKNLAVDHDHKHCPGKKACRDCIRGLLCSTDNQLLGHLRDDPAMVQRILDYLQDPPARKVLDT